MLDVAVIGLPSQGVLLIKVNGGSKIIVDIYRIRAYVARLASSEGRSNLPGSGSNPYLAP